MRTMSLVAHSEQLHDGAAHGLIIWRCPPHPTHCRCSGARQSWPAWRSTRSQTCGPGDSCWRSAPAWLHGHSRQHACTGQCQCHHASRTGRRSGAHADAFQGMTTRLTLAGAQGLQAGLVAQSVLAGLHHQRQPAVDVLLALLLLVLNACTAAAAVEVSGRRGSSEDAQAAPTHSRALTTFLDSALDDMVTDTSFSAYAQTAWRGAPVSTYPARAICLLLSPAAMHGMSGVPKGSRGRVLQSGRDGQRGRRRYGCMKVWEITFFKIEICNARAATI